MTATATGGATRWAAAKNLDDLGALCIAWLNGEIAKTPLYYAPCLSKLELAPALTAVNRAGLVTDNAGRAGSDDDESWTASAEGFASAETAARLAAAVEGTPLTLTVLSWGDPLPDGIRADWDAWIAACPAAALRACLHVTVEDPEPGRDDVLWPALEAFAGGAP